MYVLNMITVCTDKTAAGYLHPVVVLNNQTCQLSLFQFHGHVSLKHVCKSPNTLYTWLIIHSILYHWFGQTHAIRCDSHWASNYIHSCYIAIARRFVFNSTMLEVRQIAKFYYIAVVKLSHNQVLIIVCYGNV